MITKEVKTKVIEEVFYLMFWAQIIERLVDEDDGTAEAKTRLKNARGFRNSHRYALGVLCDIFHLNYVELCDYAKNVYSRGMDIEAFAKWMSVKDFVHMFKEDKK